MAPKQNISGWTSEHDAIIQRLYDYLKKQGFNMSRSGQPDISKISLWALRELDRRIQEEQKK